jgi:hypothetical protein
MGRCSMSTVTLTPWCHPGYPPPKLSLRPLQWERASKGSPVFWGECFPATNHNTQQATQKLPHHGIRCLTRVPIWTQLPPPSPRPNIELFITIYVIVPMKSILIYRNLSKDSTTMRPIPCRQAFTITATATLSVAAIVITAAIVAAAVITIVAVVAAASHTGRHQYFFHCTF